MNDQVSLICVCDKLHFSCSIQYNLSANSRLAHTETQSLGKYGRMRRVFLEQNKPMLFNDMVLTETLFPHLREVQRTCEKRIALLMTDLLEKNAHKHHWLKTIGVNPDDIFGKVQMSYLDYYYKLFFDLRNPSAHSYGNVHYALLRKQAVEAQCFAAIIVREYIRTNILDEEQAIDSLNFNRDLLARVSENMSTKITK